MEADIPCGVVSWCSSGFSAHDSLCGEVSLYYCIDVMFGDDIHDAVESFCSCAFLGEGSSCWAGPLIDPLEEGSLDAEVPLRSRDLLERGIL